MMSEPDRPPVVDALLTELIEVAAIAGRAVVVPPAGMIRRRAHRRAVRRRLSAGAFAVLLVLAGAVGVRQLQSEPRPPAVTGLHPPTPTDPAAVPATTPSGTATAAPGTATAAPGSPSAARTGTQSTVVPCRKARLAVAVAPVNAPAGHRAAVLVFVNIGDGPCRFTGYPGVAALNGAGAQVAQAKRTTRGYLGGLPAGGTPPQVTLPVGQSASALVEAVALVAVDVASCTPYSGLLVTAPDDTESTQLLWATDSCTGLEIHPVVPGVTGRSD